MPIYEYQHAETGERRETMRSFAQADVSPWPGPWKRTMSLPAPPCLRAKYTKTLSDGESLRRVLHRAETTKAPAMRDYLRDPRAVKMLKRECAA
jgi:hypothetical protein